MWPSKVKAIPGTKPKARFSYEMLMAKRSKRETIFHFLSKKLFPLFLFDILKTQLGVSEVNRLISSLQCSSCNHLLLDGNKPDNPFTLKGFLSLSAIAFDKWGNSPEERLSFFLDKINKSFSSNSIDTNSLIQCSFPAYFSQKKYDSFSQALFHLLKLSGNLPSPKNDINQLINFFYQLSSVHLEINKLAEIGLNLSKETIDLLAQSFSQTKTGAFTTSRSGVTLLVVKDVVSIVIYSPFSDAQGNSSRGVQVAREILSKYFN